MISHPDDSQIERFATGPMDDDADLVAHLAACEECSKKLEREAILELAMMDVRAKVVEEVAPATEAKAPRPRTSARVVGPAFAFAAAAAVLLWFGQRAMRSHQPSADAKPVPVVTCADGPQQVTCIAEAHRAGAYLEYPKGNSLAALGSLPGLTVSIEPTRSDGVVFGFETFVAKLEPEIRRCAEQEITSQNAPILTGEIGLELGVSADGVVSESQHSIIIRGPEEYDREGAPSPRPKMVHAVAVCISKAVTKFRLSGTSRDMRLRLSVKYVWRE